MKISIVLGTLTAVALVVVALFGWGSSGELAQHAHRPVIVLWAIRSGAIAAFAAAQVLGMTYLVDVFYSRGKIGEWTRLAAGFVCTAALLAAMGLLMVSK